MTFETGTFDIEPLTTVTVTITEHSLSKVYNATDYTVSGYDVEISSPLYTEADFTFSGNATVTARNAGTHNMNLKPEDFTNINPNFANVNFVIKDGALTITPKPVTVTADNKSKIYGDADPVLTYTTEGLAGSDYIVATLRREAGTNVGDYVITATAQANRNYTITTVPGTLTIEPRQVTVTAGNKTKAYGTADPTLTATVTGLVNGESAAELISYKLSRAAGENVGDYAITASGAAAQGNYIVTYVPGTLTIVPDDTVVVTITPNNGTFKYDGTEKDLSGYTVSISNPLYTTADFDFNGNSDLKGTNAGTYNTTIKATDFANKNANFTKVVFQVEPGTLTITRRSVILTSPDATKAYDGTALTTIGKPLDVSGDGFVGGDGVRETMTGRITNVGTTENRFTYVMASGLESNYDISTEFGTLTVTAQQKNPTLTIVYKYEDETPIRTVTREYAPGQTYNVSTAVMVGTIEGYEPDREIVTGTMPAGDYTEVVTFSPKAEGGTDRPAVDFKAPDGSSLIPIDDYGTPLGVGDSIMGGGEIIE